MGKKDEASKKSISNLNGNVMSPWWQWISLLINWSCQGQIGKQTYPLASCSTSSLCSLLWKGAGGSLRRVTMVCVCVFAHEMSRSKGDAASTASSVFSWGRLPEKKYKVIPCKHIYTNVNTQTLTIAYPTVTAQPSSLHRQLGPARFLSEAMERAGGGVGGWQGLWDSNKEQIRKERGNRRRCQRTEGWSQMCCLVSP